MDSPEICTSSLPIIDEFLPSVLSVSPGSDSTDALVSWFCDNSPQSVYKLAKSRSRANTVFMENFNSVVQILRSSKGKGMSARTTSMHFLSL